MAESMKTKVPETAPASSSMLPPAPVHQSLANVSCKHLSDACSSKMLIQNYNNFKISAAPVRIMFYRARSWVDFEGQELESLLSDFKVGKPVTELEIGGAKYVFDFMRMVQIDLGSANQRSIAWIDGKSKPFFPKFFVDDDEKHQVDASKNLKIAVDVRVDEEAKGKNALVTNSLINNVHEQGGEANGSGFKRPRLTLTDLVPITFRWRNARLSPTNSTTYSFVSDLFLSRVAKFDRGATITSIHEFILTGPLERARWGTFEKQNGLTKKDRHTANMVYAWYAASAEAVASIFSTGFAVPKNTDRLPMPAHGVGTYLCPLDSLRPSAMLSEVGDNGEKRIILCRVILGSVEKVKAGSLQAYPSSPDFDTGSDDPENPKWYVVWCHDMNTRIFPECVVSYKPSTVVPGLLRAVNAPKLALSSVKLLGEMKKHLAPSKLQKVLALHEAFRMRRLNRESFTKRLREITGDEMLLTIIHQIHSTG